MRKCFFVMVLLPVMALNLSAETEGDDFLRYPKLKIDLPLVDMPYQQDAVNTVGRGVVRSYVNPSMNLSLSLTTNLISSFHYGLNELLDFNYGGNLFTISYNLSPQDRKNLLIYNASAILGYLVFVYMPGGSGWLHEEYHRAILTRNGTNSFNDMNTFPFGAEFIYVNDIRDEDLIRFKRENPHDFIRAHAAGIEGSALLVRNLQRNNFFYNQNLYNEILYAMELMNTHMYIQMSATSETVDEFKKTSVKETKMSERDFTGFDFTAWVYDLFKPNEPYEARGVHPTGVGINRERTIDDLTKEELRYLKQQSYWQFLNYVSPMIFGIRSIKIADDLEGNFALRHNLTSFGINVSADVFVKKQRHNMIFTLHNNMNYKNYFPAIEAELIDYKLDIVNTGVFLSPRVIIGAQPADQDFFTSQPEFLGLLGCRMDYRLHKHLLPYAEVVAKTDGWVAGNEYLEENVSYRVGVSARF